MVRNIFKQLIEISSPSGDERDVLLFIEKYCLNLGAVTKYDTFGNLYIMFGEQDRDKSLFFCAHVDTVFPTKGMKVVEQDGIIRSAGKTILGADNKAAIEVRVMSSL